ncbi:MAG: hypothetical protein KDA72_02755 [Planctomycetales bacterium]|nr:hypothetical protein [Planctomycetales bacterium]
MGSRAAVICIGILVCVCVAMWLVTDPKGGGEILSLTTSGAYAAVGESQEGAAGNVAPARKTIKKDSSATTGIPLIHCADIFHPPADPDDFWDLATVYALMKQGKVDLRGIVFDYCQPMVIETCPDAGDSAVGAVAQLNYLTGAAVPAAMGSSRRLESTSDSQSDAPLRDRAGVNLILKILRESSEPVAISVVGSSIDVALAANTAPDLFREKCRAVYLLAGTGTTDPEKRANFCYNVRLDSTAFRSCFSLPCPLYWIPTFETVPSGPDWYFHVEVQRYGCFWRFAQQDVLPFLSPPMQNYFIYAFSHEKSPNWLRFLQGEVDGDLLTQILDPSRSVESNFRLYSVLTVEDQILSGMLASETRTSIELVDTKGERHSVQRDDIAKLISSMKSLMPEGFEKQIAEDELIDLLAFLTARGKFLPLPLDKAATVVTTQGMFFNRDAQFEQLVLPDWAPQQIEGIPFVLIDPQGRRVPNAIMLNAPFGTYAPRLPKAISIPCNTTATAFHFLGGVSGMGYPRSGKGTVSLIVRIHYADGESEEHELINGVHLADFTQHTDVAQSKLAIKIGGYQLRFLSVHPQRTAPVDRLELVKGPDGTAPLVLAITAERE